MRRDDEKMTFGPNVVQRIEHLRPVRTPVLNSVLLPRLALGDLDSRSISLGLAQGGSCQVRANDRTTSYWVNSSRPLVPLALLTLIRAEWAAIWQGDRAAIWPLQRNPAVT